MLTSAFGDYDQIMSAYELAIKEGYKFGVYGDAMLII
jgi:S-adenosylmethionine:tRNA ribosyltransferase-isomerase